MSHRINVGDKIAFKSEAQTKANVSGNLSTERVCFVDNFAGTTLDSTNDYVVTVGGTSDSFAMSAGGVHGVTGTTGTGDNEVSFMSTALIFDISQAPEIEARIKISDVSGTFVFFGFSDATSETTPAASIDADSGTLTAVATDAAGFVIDADLGTSSIYCASANTGAAVQSADTGIDWADNETRTLRVKLDTSGNATFYVDGLQKGYIASAVADVPLCKIVNIGTRANDGANTVFIRITKHWQDVP